MDLTDLNARFIWTRDKRLDSWRILRGTGALRGDCDDYAATALYVTCGGSMLRWWWMVVTLQAVFWAVRDPNGAPHLVLWVRGRGWIDNWYPAFGPFRHRKQYPALLPIPAIKMFIGWVAK